MWHWVVVPCSGAVAITLHDIRSDMHGRTDTDALASGALLTRGNDLNERYQFRLENTAATESEKRTHGHEQLLTK